MRSPQQVHVADEQVVHAVAAGGGRLVVALDLADSPARLPAPGAGDVLAGAATVGREGVHLPAYGWAVLIS